MFDIFVIVAAKYLVYFLLVLAVIYILLQEKSLKKKITWLTVFTLPTVFAVAKILSHFYYDTRPFVSGHFAPLISHAADNGFPSDHGLLSFALASIIFASNRKWGAAFFIVGIIIGAARVFVGIHSPVDILGSAAISIAVTIFYSVILKHFNKPA